MLPIRCPLCEGDVSATVATLPRAGREFTVRECAACAHRFTHPVPAPEDFALFYDDDAAYQAFRTERRSGRSALYVWLRDLRLRHRARVMTRRAGKPGRCLEFGCGMGDFLLALRERGWDVVGIEPSARAAEACRQKGLDVTQGADPALAQGPFDLIVLWHVIEHVPDPVSTLKSLRGLLADDGLLAIAMPNLDSLDAKHYAPEHWFGTDVPRHLQHFTQRSMRALCARLGWRTESTWRQLYDPWQYALFSERGWLPLRLAKAAAVGTAAWAWGVVRPLAAPCSCLFLRKKS